VFTGRTSRALATPYGGPARQTVDQPFGFVDGAGCANDASRARSCCATLGSRAIRRARRLGYANNNPKRAWRRKPAANCLVATRGQPNAGDRKDDCEYSDNSAVRVREEQRKIWLAPISSGCLLPAAYAEKSYLKSSADYLCA
jgi:hypothetical protein